MTQVRSTLPNGAQTASPGRHTRLWPRRAAGLAGLLMAAALSGCAPRVAAPTGAVSPEAAARAILDNASGQYLRPSVTGLTNLSLSDVAGVEVRSPAVNAEVTEQFKALGLTPSRIEVVVSTRGGCAALRGALQGAGWTRKIEASTQNDENGWIMRQNAALRYALRTSGESCVGIFAQVT